MDELNGKVAIVCGAAGGVGEGIVKTLLKRKATVIAISRSAAKLELLRQYVSDIDSGQLHTLQGDLGNEEDALALQSKVYKLAKNLDLVIASLGGWWQGKPLTSVDISTWNRIMTENLTSHYLAIRMFIPLLNPRSGYYFHINGYGGDKPYPMAAPVVMAASAQKTMVMCLAEELHPTSIRVYELQLGPVNTRSRIAKGMGHEDWYYPEEIGEHIYRLMMGMTGTEHELVQKLESK